MKNYSREDIIRIVEEEDVEFIRLQFTDMSGMLKNVALTPVSWNGRWIISAYLTALP